MFGKRLRERMVLGKYLQAFALPMLLLFLFFASASCSARKAEKNTVKFMSWGDVYNRKFNEKMVAEFQKQEQPSFEVKFLGEHSGAYTQKLVTLAASKMLPDVVLLLPGQLKSLASRKAILPLDSYLKDADFVKNKTEFWPRALEGGQWEGTQYGIPQWAWTIGVYYNKDVFDKFGVTYPKEGWTWDDFLNKAKATTDTSNPRDKYYGFETHTSLSNFFTDYMFRNVGDLYSNDLKKCLIDTPEGIRAVKWYFDLFLKHKVAPQPSDSAGMQKQQGSAFLAGKIAMISAGRDQIDVMEEANVKFRWGFVSMPRGKYETGIQLSPFLAISANSKNPENAWKFIKFCVSHEAQKIVTTDRSDISILKTLTYTPEYINYKGLPAINLAFREMMEHTKPIPFVAGMEEWESKTNQTFQLMGAESISVEQGCRDIGNSYREMVVNKK